MLRKFKIKIDGNEYEVEMEELTSNQAPVQQAVPVTQPAPVQQQPAPAAQPVATPAQPAASGIGNGEAVDAPMPGNILRINVAVGDTVTENQSLLILEAMKMENDIVAPKAGTVTGITVNKGDTVNAGDALVTID